MTPRAKLSEKGKAYALCLLFPLLWPLAFAMALCDLAEAIGSGLRRLRARMRRR